MWKHGRTVLLREKNGQDRGDAVQIGDDGLDSECAGRVERGYVGQGVALWKRRVAVRGGIFRVRKGLRRIGAGESCGIGG